MKTGYLSFLNGLDADLREALLQKLRVRWTHTSTSLEGNTLSEGETLGILQYGLTIAGKPLAHHNEVLGHSRAIDLLHALGASGRSVTEADLFAMHASVQTAVEPDYLKPIGAWKTEPNSALVKIGGKTVINDNYASPLHIPALMNAWLEELNHRRSADTRPLDDYVWAHATFARIHPFADGNGRMARLLANLPVIAKGQLPFLIPFEQRLRYIESLATWEISCGSPQKAEDLHAKLEDLADFRLLCEEAAHKSEEILKEVQALQNARSQTK
jgi:Fic family protein